MYPITCVFSLKTLFLLERLQASAFLQGVKIILDLQLRLPLGLILLYNLFLLLSKGSLN